MRKGGMVDLGIKAFSLYREAPIALHGTKLCRFPHRLGRHFPFAMLAAMPHATDASRLDAKTASGNKMALNGKPGGST